MPEDTDQLQPASAPDSDAVEQSSDAPLEPPAPMQLQPGQSMINIGPDGMQIVSVAPPQVMTFRADKDLMRRMVTDWLHEDEQYWDVLVKARVEELRTRKQHLTLVTDPATVKRIGKSKNRLN